MHDEQSPSVFSRVSQWLKPKKASAEETPNTTGPAEHQEVHTAMPKEKPPISAEQEPSQTDDTKPRSRSRSRRRGGRSRRGKGQAVEQQTQVVTEAVSEAPAPLSKGGCKLLINTDEPEECRLAVVENGKVESFHIETVSQALAKGNIYKGRITAVEANLQAAFVDIGHAKNGFLPFSDIHPEYYAVDVAPDTHWKDLRIQDVVKKGQEVLVEVVKEATGNKGAMLTTYLSLPGRYLVLMPGSDSAGISRKIDNEAERRELRAMMESLKIPEGIGYIVRTASQEITKTALGQDVRFLLNLWKDIKKKGQTEKAPALLHRDQDIVARFLRDHFTGDIKEILVDDEEALVQVQGFLDLLP
ncbi:MAG TPA: ribonuclease E/G, partial [Desulfurivibrionaceae bacterium]|nr:ribonuclease E/G [Desulfurivibrionaceae bacterium]